MSDYPAGPQSLGALVGWKRHRSLNGNVVLLQTASSVAQAKAGEVKEFYVSLNARQLRALAHDLVSAADEIDGKTPSQKAGGIKTWFLGGR